MWNTCTNVLLIARYPGEYFFQRLLGSRLMFPFNFKLHVFIICIVYLQKVEEQENVVKPPKDTLPKPVITPKLDVMETPNNKCPPPVSTPMVSC